MRRWCGGFKRNLSGRASSEGPYVKKSGNYPASRYPVIKDSYSSVEVVQRAGDAGYDPWPAVNILKAIHFIRHRNVTGYLVCICRKNKFT